MSRYDREKIEAIERTYLTPHWIPAKDLVAKTGEDVNYLISVIREQRLIIAELENKVRF